MVYRSCMEIEEGLSFREDSIQHCCSVFPGGGCALLGYFEGNSLPIERIISEKNRLRNAHKKGEATACAGCPHLIEQDWPERPYYFRHVNINDFTECNLRCEYCYLQQGFQRRRRSHQLAPLLEDLINNGCLADDTVFHWGGGEVTVYQDFAATSRLLMQHGYRQLVNTNAVMYSQEIERGLSSGLMTVQVSVDAGTRETYQRVKGRDAFDQVWRHLAAYAKAGTVTVKYIVQEHTVADGDIYGFVECCKANGIHAVHIVPENQTLCTGTLSRQVIEGVAKLIWKAYRAGLNVQGADDVTFRMFWSEIAAEIQQLSDASGHCQGNEIVSDIIKTDMNIERNQRILFVGYAHSTHTHAWVELLQDQPFDVKVYGVEDNRPPQSFAFPTKVYSDFYPGQPYSVELESRALAEFISSWQPDIIHTLGLYPASFCYLIAREVHGLQHIGRWLVTARGGPDLALHRLIPEEREKIRQVLLRCDQLIADNIQNYQYALELGLLSEKIAPIGVVPGTGGVDCDALAQYSMGKPSVRDRVIVWPKAYECPASKALPIFEALQLCWDRIRPCTIFMTAATQEEIHYWFETMPGEIKQSCRLLNRIPRQDLLTLMGRSRVLLAPSLADGIPNTLYEAMALGLVPVFSPLETIQSVVTDKNVIFARNLYPQEIAEALVNAMNNDSLADAMAQENLKAIRRLANRDTIKTNVVLNYLNVLRL